MSKFVGKFRKNQNYNDDSYYDRKKRSHNEHSEIKKLKNATQYSIDLTNEPKIISPSFVMHGF